MNKILRWFVFPSFLLILSADNTLGCSCIFVKESLSIEQQVKGAYKDSAAVFIGEVSEIIRKPDVYFILVKFKIEKSWNKNAAEEIMITTGKGSGDCGYGFVVGKKYLVYAYGEKDGLETNVCTRTAAAESNRDIFSLNKLKKSKIKYFPK